MINSVNTLEFLKPKLISMDKLNTSSTTRIHHHHNPTSHTPTRTFYTFVTNSNDTLNSTLMISGEQRQLQQQQQRPSLRQERVKVQHLENHTKLQNNNCWNNFRTLLSASPCGTVGDAGVICQELREEREYDLEVDDIQNKSAFTLEFNKRNIFSNSSNNNNIISKKRNEDSKSSSPNAIETNNHFLYKHQNGFINKQPQPKTMMVILPRRTEDQEHAYRRIESVHNYAKLKSYDDEATDTQSPNGSRHSSYLDDEEDDGEEEEGDDDDDEEDDDNNDADYDVEEDEMIDLDGDYEDIFNRRRFPKLPTFSTANGAIISPKLGAKKSLNFMTSQRIHSSRDNPDEETDLQVDVDVETVENPANNTMPMMNCSGGGNDSPAAKPDHHARRPMNAFLIFCKRHRAIVKERYKTLENRAITKILGDWWASLDINDKKCFTSLAQQNKDAFFSANPNFKWYKLPAPPLRTLNTRPTNCNSTGGGGSGTVEYDESGFAVIESISNNTRSNTNYFKLADEAQMGDLSQLMQDKSKSKQCALQQALGETSQFMRSHITGPQDEFNTEEKQQLKRRFYNENSFSSNSSEEDGLVPKKKTARSCKGKIYQELINSGQIAAPAVKKSKSTQRLCGVETVPNDNNNLERTELTRHQVEPSQVANNAVAIVGAQKAGACEAADNMFSYDLSSFDLEEKIKELPALSLDDYLQRKRNTKKKKKFTTTNGKKRGNRSNNSNSNTNNTICNAASQISGCNLALNASPQLGSPISEHVTDCRAIQQRKQQQQQAVGSQKRKARKESITRRDVSAIEQEVASLLPLTINGCCYFQEAPLPLSPVITSYKNVTIEKDINSPTNTVAVEYFTAPTSSTIPLTTTIIASAPSSSTSPSPPQQTLAPPPPESITCRGRDSMNNILNDNMISSTSDLLILAEVAANRTELKH